MGRPYSPPHDNVVYIAIYHHAIGMIDFHQRPFFESQFFYCSAIFVALFISLRFIVIIVFIVGVGI
jgi:hypothetical protein